MDTHHFLNLWKSYTKSTNEENDDVLYFLKFWAGNGLQFGFLIFRDISGRAGRGFKRFLEAVGFILAKFEPKRSHGDPIRDQNYGFGTYDMCWNIEIYGNI